MNARKDALVPFRGHLKCCNYIM